MRRILCVLILLVNTVFLFAEQYQVVDVQYDLDGRTREYALNKALDIRRDLVLESEEELKLYVDFIAQKLRDQRVLEDSSVTYELGEAENGIVPVTLFIRADETWNILPLPYPKYDSNSGFTLKIKVKDYNFLGTMEPLDFDLEFYQEDEGTKNVLGTDACTPQLEESPRSSKDSALPPRLSNFLKERSILVEQLGFLFIFALASPEKTKQLLLLIVQ